MINPSISPKALSERLAHFLRFKDGKRPSPLLLSILSLAVLAADLALCVMLFRLWRLGPSSTPSISDPQPSAVAAGLGSLAGSPTFIALLALGFAVLIAKELWDRKAITLALNIIALPCIWWLLLAWGGLIMRPF